MKRDLRLALWNLLPAWMACILLPLPALLSWRSEAGQCVAIWCFFIGCTSLVAYAFRPGQLATQLWNERVKTVGISLFSAWVVCSFFWLAVADAKDFVALFLMFQILIPSFCVVPYMTLVTRKPFAAIVFSLFLVGTTKLLGCVAVVLVYGWHADARGYTTMPWTHPNLLVLLFWLNNCVLSLSFYVLGRKRFLRAMVHAA